MIQIRYYLSIILLLLLTSCISNNNESQSDNPYNIKYIELSEIESFNENGTVEYQFRLPILINNNLKKLNRYILESVASYLEVDKLNVNYNVLDLDLLKSFIKYHTNLVEIDNYRTDTEHLELLKRIDIDTTYTKNQIIVLEERKESYTGGAHGAYSTKYSVFDSNKERFLLTTDIFDIDKLKKVAYDYFLIERGLARSNIDIEKEGYWFKDNKFHLNENFSIDNNFVTFLFNPYEIASYAEGQITIEIPKNRLESIIKKEYKFIINKD